LLLARVLIADDGSDNRRLLAHLLAVAGARVEQAGDGHEAVRMALEADAAGDPVGVVLMDLQMPGLDGYAATRRLRAAGYTRPIVAVTAHAAGEDRAACLEAGFDDYATKPLPRAALVEMCRRWAARAAPRAA
jgi:CheY-like chemotaxis protein